MEVSPSPSVKTDELRWWQRQRLPQTSPASERKRAVAYYRHSAQDRQENSVPLQREQVRKWAEEHGVDIIQEFADHGKSGLSTEDRDAFNDMIDNWVKKRSDFEYVLVLDVSRWGRFQDTDLSAVYSAECTKHRKQVIYISIGIPKKDDPLYSVYVTFERYRAAQYSRELSDLNESRRPVQILKRGERKSIQNQRVTLTAGNERQTAVIRRIFQSFVDGASEAKIADSLNRDNIPSPGGTLWDSGKVRSILTNEMYTGTIVYNKTSQRLLSPPRPNPKLEWVRTPDAFKGIITKQTFDKAQAIFDDRAKRGTRENMLARLKAQYEEHGFIKSSLIEADPHAPSVETYRRCFGGIDQAFLELFKDVLTQIRGIVHDQLAAVASSIQMWDDFIVLNDCLTVMIQPSIPIPYGSRTYWSFQSDRRIEVDVTLGVPLSCKAKPEILGYLALPRLIVRANTVRLYGPSDAKVEMFGHNGLELLKEILR